MRQEPETDFHHIVFNGKEHELRQESRDIRLNKSLIPQLDRQVHKELHKACPAIPLLGQYALFRVRRDFEGVPGDPLASIDNLMFAMEKASEHPKAHPLERQLAQIAIQSVELQKPFIKEGLIDGPSKRISTSTKRASRSFEREPRYDPIWA